MIETPRKNVKFTDEQQHQLDEWRSRVNVLHEEILSGEKRLKELRGETSRAEKEGEYQREKLAEVTGQLTAALLVRDEALEEESSARERVKTHYAEVAAGEEVHESKRQEISKREADISARETAVMLREESSKKNSVQLMQDKQEVENARETILRALETITWR